MSEKDTLSDKMSIQAIRKDRLDGLKSIYKKYVVRLTAVCVRLGVPYEEAEEIVNDCFLKLWEKRAGIYETESIYPFLSKLVKNKTIDSIRAKAKYLATAPLKEAEGRSGGEDLFQKIAHAQELENIHQAMELMPVAMRHIANLYFFRGLSQEEIARQEAISVRTVETQIRRARQKLRKKAEFF